MDPGVLCPNSGLEAIAWRAPKSVRDLKELPELKGWFVREFGGEMVEAAKQAEPAGKASPAPAPTTEKPARRSKKKGSEKSRP